MAVIPKKLTFQLHFRNKTKTRKILSRDFRLRGLLKKDSNNSNGFCYSFDCAPKAPENASFKGSLALTLKKPSVFKVCKSLPLRSVRTTGDQRGQREFKNATRVKKERQEQKSLLKTSLMTLSLRIRNQKIEKTKTVVTKAGLKKYVNDTPSYLKRDLLEIKTDNQEHPLIQKAEYFPHATVKTGVKNKLKAREVNGQNYLIKSNKYLYKYKKTFFFRPSWFFTNRIRINNYFYISAKKLKANRLQSIESPLNNTFRPQKFLNISCLSNRNTFCNNIFKPDYIFLKKKETAAAVLRKNKLLFGRYGICFKQYSIISSKCVETAKLDIAKILRKKGRFWIRICCDTPVSARPAETRMGKGKGSISYWAAKVNPGQLFFEFSGVGIAQLKDIYQKLCKKSAVSLKMIG